MTNIPMPEPIGWITSESIYRLERGGNDSKGTVPIHKSRSYVAKTPVLLTTQAEAYKDACVREALEAAARRCVESPMMNTDVYCGGTARLCADRILSLIPHNDNEQGNY